MSIIFYNEIDVLIHNNYSTVIINITYVLNYSDDDN